jgi:hypothetical protein
MSRFGSRLGSSTGPGPRSRFSVQDLCLGLGLDLGPARVRSKVFIWAQGQVLGLVGSMSRFGQGSDLVSKFGSGRESKVWV